MLRYALLSAGLHLAIIVMAIVGLLNYNTDVVDIAQPLPVELVDTIEDISKSPDPRPESPQKEEPKEKPKKEITPPPPQPEPTPEPEPLPEKVPEEVVPLPEPKAEPEPKVEEKIPEPTIEPPKAKPTFKKPPTVKPKPKAKPRDFDSILKNLTPRETKQAGGQGGALSDHLAASELDRVRKQIESVWRLPAGVKGMHEITIKITIYMNPDRTVRDAKLVNQSLLTNPTYSILAETALRAVNEFRYTPLHLPTNKYKIWKEITMEFDPRHLL